MMLAKRVSVACAILACVLSVKAEERPQFKSAAGQHKQTTADFLESAPIVKQTQVKATLPQPNETVTEAAVLPQSEETATDLAAVATATPACQIELVPDSPQTRIIHTLDPAARRENLAGPRDLNWPQPCPAGALFSQRPDTGEDGDTTINYIMADTDEIYTICEGFWNVGGYISGMSWYGGFMNSGMHFACGSQPREFEIRFYADAGGQPGAEVAFFSVLLVGEPTDMLMGHPDPAAVEQYTLTIDPPLEMSSGWISIQSTTGVNDCYFCWVGCSVIDPPGDKRYCYIDTRTGDVECQDPALGYACDLNLCLLGTFYPGSCCDDLTGGCESLVEYVDCLPPLRFTPGVTCEQMDPACGDITGACCDSETCIVMTPSECLGGGGEYKGDYVPCDPNPCVGACCLGYGICEVHTESDCLVLNGDYVGDATNCDPNPCPPLNDDCSNPEHVAEGYWDFDTTYATYDGPHACDIGRNVWFCYTASATGTVTVQFGAVGILWEVSCAAYDGCACDPTPTFITCDTELGQVSLEFDVVAGSQYLIELGAHASLIDGGLGSIQISLDAWPYGACCTEDAPYCIETYEPDCAGTFAGAGTTCGDDCNGSGSADACDIATGYSRDCNENGIPDECDITGGTSDDVDLNGVPDECDPDCNNNGIIDSCDTDCATGNCYQIVGCGGSNDCQPNGVPDECELGGLGSEENLLWDNGPTDYEDSYSQLSSQVGGYNDGAFIVDDFYLEGATRISAFHAEFREEMMLTWSGRVRIEVYPDNGASGPDDSMGPIVELWVPTDGGSVTRTLVDAGDYASAYDYDVSNLDIQLDAGIWWIGIAPEASFPFGGAGWSSSHGSANVVMGEAHLRWPQHGIGSFMPAGLFDPGTPSWDVAFTVSGAMALGADCNENLIPDDCDITNCDGSPWCLDCNDNGIPDGCEPDCNANGIADECDIANCDGSPWCQDCNWNGIPDGCDPDCNGNGIADECDLRDCDGSAWCSDCNQNDVMDECDIAAGTSDDYDLNGTPDECDPDCNGNGIIDGCDIDCTTGNCNQIVGCGQSLDCQPDGIPDDCQMYNEFEYLADDGTAESRIGVNYGGYLGWLTQFNVTDGFDGVTAISMRWANIPAGTPFTAYLWSDPNGDGDPSDAQVLSFADALVLSPEAAMVVDIPDAYVGPVGTSFFVGAIIQLGTESKPASRDVNQSQGRSWFVADQYAPIDPNALNAAQYSPGRLDDIGLPGNWLMRATGFINNDCNANGIPDDCDIAADPSLDCDGDLKIDACEWEDCNANGVLDTCDMLECDGSPWCGDCNGNGIPDECDIAAGAADWQPNGIPDECEEDCNANGIPDDRDIVDCDGSAWCDDCNQNGILDECETGSAGGAIYQYDDGSTEDCLGVGDTVELVWIHHYDAIPGSETIVAIATCFGTTSPMAMGPDVSPGDTVRVFVWDDPDGDGAPYDAVLLASATGIVEAGSISTDVLQEVPIGPVTVSGSFFIGAGVVSAGYPAPLDMNGDIAHESWITAGWIDMGGFDPNSFWADNLDQIGFSSNFLLTAVSEFRAAANDCNGNGVPDDCDLLGDLDGNGSVDYDDYVMFRSAFGGAADGSPAHDWCCDYDGSGAVGLADYNTWLAGYRDFIGDEFAGPPEAPNTPTPGISGQDNVQKKRKLPTGGATIQRLR